MTDPGLAGPSALRIVLVDDQRLVRSGFELMLSVEDDIEIVGQAADGQEALEVVARTRPDVVLMDVQMPRMDGIEATRRIVSGAGAAGAAGAAGSAGAAGTGGGEAGSAGVPGEAGSAGGGASAGPRVVILTTFDRDDYVFAGLRAGASGFLLKNCEPDQLVDAIRAAGHGHALLAPEVTRRVIEQMVTPSASATAQPTERAQPTPEAARSPEHAAALARLTEREREVLTLVAEGLSNAEIAARLFLGEATVKTHVSNCLSKLHLRDRVQAVVFAYEARLVLPGE